MSEVASRMVAWIAIVGHYIGIACTLNKEFHNEPSRPLVMASASLQFIHLIYLVRASLGIDGR